ncbi:MAG: Rpn family recombination-promoting nuclease/putative transposase [Bacteroidales bacterium]|nr:Rpn family recombination-promoting nuclease/putative transposase [Bacteroidales bacterium]
MRELEDRYISLLTDFGFKRIFGTAPNKELLICFLNSLFDGAQVIRDVKYLNNEHLGDSGLDRKAIFDVYCEGENGEKFIVEMQNAYQEFFKDRSLFYTTFPIREQAEKGSDWDFRLTHVYTVALLNFDMHEESFDTADICHTVKLCDVKTHKVFYRKLDFIYVEIAKFDKTEDELVTLYDKWLYVLKNLSRLESRPKVLLDKVFDRLFEEAEIAKFTPRELREYEDSRKAYRDLKNSLDTAKREGIAEGMEKGLAEGMERGLAEGLEKGFEKGRLEERRKAMAEKQEIARQLLATGMTAEQVSAIVGLPLEEVQGM